MDRELPDINKISDPEIREFCERLAGMKQVFGEIVHDDDLLDSLDHIEVAWLNEQLELVKELLDEKIEALLKIRPDLKK